MNIAFFERDYDNGHERKDFQVIIEQLGISRYSIWDDKLIKNIPDVLFFHGNDMGILRPKVEGKEVWKLELNGVWLVMFGGDPTAKDDFTAFGDKVIGYIKYSDLQARLSEIVDEIKALKRTTKERLEEIIFAVDPDIEKLLAELCTKSPFAESWDPYSRNKRKDLIDLINQKHGMTLK